MNIVDKIEAKLWDERGSSKYKYVENYIERWHEVFDEGYNDYSENFQIFRKDDEANNIDLNKTLSRMPDELLLKIAYDLEIETPGFLPVVAEKFKIVLEANNFNAKAVFENAIHNVYSNPSDAVLNASSALDGIIKTILEDDRFEKEKPRKDGLSKRMGRVMTSLGLNKKSGAPDEIIGITSSLDNIVQRIDDLRSSKTNSHGTLPEDYIIDDPLWAEFAINSAATVGLFIWEYYEKRFKTKEEVSNDNSFEIDLDSIPF